MQGETSGHFINVRSVHPDCDRDSLVYLGDPIGPACHTVPVAVAACAVAFTFTMLTSGQHMTCASVPCPDSGVQRVLRMTNTASVASA